MKEDTGVVVEVGRGDGFMGWPSLTLQRQDDKHGSVWRGLWMAVGDWKTWCLGTPPVSQLIFCVDALQL